MGWDLGLRDGAGFGRKMLDRREVAREIRVD